jgi:membrane associated rhomboid family serine protease
MVKLLGPEIRIRLRRAPVTAAGVVLSALLSCAVWAGWISHERLVTDVRFLIEPWRLVSSAPLHVDAGHLIVDAWWLARLGEPLEARLGHWRYLGALTLFAVGSAAAEHALFRGGVGLSGVVYGVFCLLWVLARREQGLRAVVDSRTAYLMVGWFFFCILTTVTGVWPVANAGHAFGAVLGLLVGAAMTGSRLRPVIGALVALVVLPLVAAFPLLHKRVSVTPQVAAAVAAYSGWHAYHEHRFGEALLLYLDAAELDATQATSWYGLGAAEQVGGFTDEAIENYRRAAALAPGEPMYRNALEALEASRALETNSEVADEAEPPADRR